MALWRVLDLYKPSPAKQFAKTRIKGQLWSPSEMGRSPLTRLANRPIILRSSAYFEFYSFYIFQAFFAPFCFGRRLSVSSFLLSFLPLCMHWSRYISESSRLYPKCLVKYVIFHFLSCMLIAHKEKHHIEIMRRLRCGYLKSQIDTLQSHGQSKYLPFPYIKSYKKESEQA